MSDNNTNMNQRPTTQRPAQMPTPMGGNQRARMMNALEKPKDFKKTMKNLLAYLGAYKPTIIVVILLAAMSSALSILGPITLSRVTNNIVAGVAAKLQSIPGAGIDFALIGRIILTLLALYCTSVLCNYTQGFLISGVAQKVSYNMRKAILEKIGKLPFSYFDGKTHGEILSRVTNDVDMVSNTLNQSLSQMITAMTTLIGVMSMMLWISWQLTLVPLVIIPLTVFTVQRIIKKSQKHFIAQQRGLGNLNGHVEEMYGGHSVVRAFNGEDESVSAFENYNSQLYASAWRSQFLSGIMMPIMGFVGNLDYVAVALLGGSIAIKGVMSIGEIQAFVQYVRSFNQPLNQTAQIANILQSTAAAAERVFEFLDEEEETPDTQNPVILESVKGDVSFDHVGFGYAVSPQGQDGAKYVISDFSADIESGQRVAIVGPTGAGKTTLVKLLMRFYDTNAGAITVDGHNIREFRRDDLRSIFGMVLQDTWLFSGTIMENIRYGNLDATDEQVMDAARAAYADHFIRSLPGGYNMQINEEATNISQGQMQLLTIARAILADPQILILDEATSSVDTRTEVLIQKAMEGLMKGRTCFIIAHRLSTIRDADRILVMDDGDIVEQGTHSELMERGGFYASLYNSQFESAS